MNDPSSFTERIARTQEQILEQRSDLPRVRRRLLASLAPRRAPPWKLAAVVAVAAAGALALLGGPGFHTWVFMNPSVAAVEIQASPEVTAARLGEKPGVQAPVVAPEPSATTSAEPPRAPVVAPHRAPRARPTAPREPAEESKEAPGWRQLALRGSYREALVEAEAAGFPGLCATLPAGDLLMLADAARFAGRVDRARQALLALRERFPTGPERAMATFTLGRVAADEQRDHLAAAHWFEATLEERSGGDLARESLGRLVESLERGGDHPAARRRAQSYLARFPDGPHAKLAYDVLQR